MASPSPDPASPRQPGAAGGGTVSAPPALRDLNAGKVNSIMKYLDDVDRASCDDRPRSPGEESRATTVMQGGLAPLGTRRSYAASEFGGTASVSGSLAGRENVFHGIKSKIEALRVENAELKQHIDRLRARVNDAELDSDREKRRLKEAHRDDLEAQRETMQAKTDEHLRCIKRLVADKESMTKLTQELSARVHTLEAARKDEVARLEAAHAKALSEVKGRLSMQDREKREKWAVEEARKIKDSTLRALEPDIAIMVNRKKADMRRMEEEHVEALRRKDDALLLKERELAETKIRLGKELEELMLRERSALRANVGDETRRIERQFEGERATLVAQHAAEVRELNDRIARQQSQIAEQQQQMALMATAEETKLRETRATMNEAMEQLRRDHRREVQRLQDTAAMDRAATDDRVKQRVDALVDERTAELREAMEAEKRKALAAAVSRLEEEQLRIHKEQRAREKGLHERLSAAERDKARWQQDAEQLQLKVQSGRDELADRDRTVAGLRHELEGARKRLQDSQTANDGEIAERLRALDGAWRAKTAALESDHVEAVEQHRTEVLRLSKAAERADAERKAEFEAAERRHAQELAAIDERVLATVTRKDQQLRQLRDVTNSLESQLRLRDIELDRHTAMLIEDARGDLDSLAA